MDKKKFVTFLALIVLILAAVGVSSPFIVKEVRLGLDLKGGFEILYQATPLEEGQKVTKESLKETAHSLEDRVNAAGVAEPEITTEGSDRIRVRIAGVVDQSEVRKTLKEPARLTFRNSAGDIVMDGSDFVPNAAKVVFDQYNQPIITIEVKDKSKFADVTKKLTGQPMSINLDDKSLGAPVVSGEMTEGKAQISGYSLDESKNIRDTINLGALPLQLTEKYTNAVDATLGQKSMNNTLLAGGIALVLILLFMAFYYRVPGLISCVTLIVFTWLLLVVYVLLNATLTLPGIAAFILGVGMAVDANIITAERIKEEIRSGKSIMSGFRSGSKVSFRTIIDSHVTTIVAAGVLFTLGIGTIKGFALTLIFSILLSLFTNVFLSRLLIQMLVKSGAVKKTTYFGVKEDEIHAL
ncbi:protein translocase subunit SecD [Gorillibacterium timonense]|uniref:protein translocase subunit SecD n=1 Tax=Gorillibacterium timonense TaxID=1689269 RepID=UPI0009E7923E|nr:protein translocase subunit SecD [Gorillibacterium timonense]